MNLTLEGFRSFSSLAKVHNELRDMNRSHQPPTSDQLNRMRKVCDDIFKNIREFYKLTDQITQDTREPIHVLFKETLTQANEISKLFAKHHPSSSAAVHPSSSSSVHHRQLHYMPSAVHCLRRVRDALVGTQEKKAIKWMNALHIHHPDVAGAVFGRVWELSDRSSQHPDFGRAAFYGQGGQSIAPQIRQKAVEEILGKQPVSTSFPRNLQAVLLHLSSEDLLRNALASLKECEEYVCPLIEELEKRDPIMANRLYGQVYACAGQPQNVPFDFGKLAFLQKEGQHVPNKVRKAALQTILNPQAQASTTPKKPKAIFIIGGSGSGKGVIRNGIETRHPGKYTVIDSDLVKQKMPRYEQLLKAGVENANVQVHPESLCLRNLLFDQTIKVKKDLIYDGTGAFLDHHQKAMNQAKSQGYRIKLIFVEADPQICKNRCANRTETITCASGAQKTVSRDVPPEIVDQSNRGARQNFPQLQQISDTWKHIDNSGPQPQLVARSSKS